MLPSKVQKVKTSEKNIRNGKAKPCSCRCQCQWFWDETGHGGGKTGIGIVIENGKVINTPKDINTPTLTSGITKYGQMVSGEFSANQLLNKNVVSAAGFMPQLIVNGEKMITNDGGWGYGPRSIMAQKKMDRLCFSSLMVDKLIALVLP